MLRKDQFQLEAFKQQYNLQKTEAFHRGKILIESLAEGPDEEKTQKRPTMIKKSKKHDLKDMIKRPWDCLG